MGSGLSMSSVNKIKELASAREYGLALELVETQDLSKSLNPQFLRLCGEIYFYNGKYVEARRVLLMAYKIAPQAKRIMYSLVELYLKMGYKKLAKTYFDMYLVDADENAEETKRLRYLYGKANHASPEELVEYLGTTYNENIDYDWSYETFLVYTMLDRQQETLSLALEYTAHYTDAPHCFVIADILEGKVEAGEVFYDDIPECEDDDPAQEESRDEERKLLHAYDLRMNPPEPEIISMVDEREEQRIEFGAKHKRKKLNKEKNESEETDLEEAEAAEAAEAAEKKEQETTDKEPAVTDTTGKSDASEADEEYFDDPLDKRPSFIKRAFSKLRLKGQDKMEEEAEEAFEEEPSLEDSSSEKLSVEELSVEELSSEKSSVEELSVEEPSFENFSFEDDEQDDLSDIEILLASRKSKEEEQEEEVMSFFDDHEDLEDTEEYFEERRNHSDSIVTDDFEGDGFEAEADSVEDFGGEKDTQKQEEPVEKETNKHKSSIIFEAATFADEDEDELPVDDFSSEEDDEFGKMRTGDEDDYDSVFVGEVEVKETKSAEEIYNDVERTFGESDAEETEEPVEEATDEPEEVVEEVEETTDEPEEVVEEVEETLEDEIEETETAEEPVEEVEEATDEPEESVEEFEETAEEPVEEVEEVTDEPEEAIETFEEVTEEIEEAAEEVEISTDAVEENMDEFVDNTEPVIAEPVESSDNISANNVAEDEPWRNIHKSSLDFPVFRSSLFPEYHTASKTDATVPESKVTSDIQEREQKLQENLRKEEQIQREAEALLASLGIDLSSSSVKTSPTPETTKQKPLSDVSIPVAKTTTIKKEPSRDELKASLKIDSVKRNLLSRLKESK